MAFGGPLALPKPKRNYSRKQAHTQLLRPRAYDDARALEGPPYARFRFAADSGTTVSGAVTICPH